MYFLFQLLGNGSRVIVVQGTRTFHVEYIYFYLYVYRTFFCTFLYCTLTRASAECMVAGCS